MPTFTFQEQGTVTLVASVHVRVAQAVRVYWTVGHVDLHDRVRYLKLLLHEFRVIVFNDDVKKTWRRSSPASSGLWS